VLDSHLRVRGVAGLRVVDAGAMPTITSGNTNSPTLMVAEKAARWILAGGEAGVRFRALAPLGWRLHGRGVCCKVTGGFCNGTAHRVLTYVARGGLL